MQKSKWKQKNLDKNTVYLIYKQNSKLKTKKKTILVFNRAACVHKALINYKLLIHKGSWFRNLIRKFYFFKKKFGEFAYTRKPFFFPRKKKKKKINLINFLGTKRFIIFK